MNIFQGIADKFKAVPEILKAKARAGQSQIQAQKVEQQLRERLKKPATPSGNVFKDIVDKYKPAKSFDIKKMVVPAIEKTQKVAESFLPGVVAIRESILQRSIEPEKK